MKKYLLLIPLLFLASTCHASFGYYKAVTTVHAKIPANQTNFPVLATTTDIGFATTGNGGHVTNANGYDIYCYSDQALTTRIACERDTYNAVTGAISWWVNFPNIHTASDDTVYFGVGDATISTDPNLDGTYGATNTWDSNYKVVYHLGDGTTLGLGDSTATGKTLTNNGTVTASTGQIGGSGDTALTKYLSANDSSLPIGSTAFTISGWYKTSSSPSSITVNYGSGGANTEPYIGIYNLGNGFDAAIVGNGVANVGDNVNLDDGKWHYIVGSQTGAGGTNSKIYVDGALKNSGNLTWNNALKGANGFTIGRDNGGSTQTYTGSNDEIRVSSTERLANWITTEYNNQVAVNSFLTFGTMTSTSGGGGGLFFNWFFNLFGEW